MEKLPGNGYENGIKANMMLDYQLQHKDRMKILCTVYLYGLNERTKFKIEDKTFLTTSNIC